MKNFIQTSLFDDLMTQVESAESQLNVAVTEPILTVEEKAILIEKMQSLLNVTYSTQTIKPLLRTDRLRVLANYLMNDGKSCISSVTGKFSMCDWSYKLAYPTLWPDEFEFYESRSYGVKSKHKYLLEGYAYDFLAEKVFFGLTDSQYKLLFSTSDQNSSSIFGYQLKSTHGRKKLAEHIITSCYFFENGGNI